MLFAWGEPLLWWRTLKSNFKTFLSKRTFHLIPSSAFQIKIMLYFITFWPPPLDQCQRTDWHYEWWSEFRNKSLLRHQSVTSKKKLSRRMTFSRSPLLCCVFWPSSALCHNNELFLSCACQWWNHNVNVKSRQLFSSTITLTMVSSISTGDTVGYLH